MKGLLLGVLLIIIIGVGGLVYRNAVEHPSQTIVCPTDAQLCPDGTSVARVGFSCTFPVCSPPNVSFADIGLVFAVPEGFATAVLPDTASLASYEVPTTSSTSVASIIIRHYTIEASSSSMPNGVAAPTTSVGAALATIQQTAISGASGAPVSVTSFTSTILGGRRFTVVSIERFEGVIDTAYYLARTTDVLRFDAIDRGADWTNPSLDVEKLPAHAALVKLLMTLQGQ